MATLGLLEGNWSTATRPSSPLPGTFGYNTDLLQVETWNGSAWALNSAPTATSSTLGIVRPDNSTITISGGVLTAPAGSPLVLTAATTYYVATTGNDSNPGTVGSPWLTLQHAVDYCGQIVQNGWPLTIQIADDTTYDGFIIKQMP